VIANYEVAVLVFLSKSDTWFSWFSWNENRYSILRIVASFQPGSSVLYLFSFCNSFWYLSYLTAEKSSKYIFRSHICTPQSGQRAQVILNYSFRDEAFRVSGLDNISCIRKNFWNHNTKGNLLRKSLEFYPSSSSPISLAQSFAFLLVCSTIWTTDRKAKGSLAASSASIFRSSFMPDCL